MGWKELSNMFVRSTPQLTTTPASQPGRYLWTWVYLSILLAGSCIKTCGFLHKMRKDLFLPKVMIDKRKNNAARIFTKSNYPLQKRKNSARIRWWTQKTTIDLLCLHWHSMPSSLGLHNIPTTSLRRSKDPNVCPGYGTEPLVQERFVRYRCHYFQIALDAEWLNLLGSYRWLK